MPDVGVAITPGLGASIATEVSNGLSYQVVLPGAHRATPYSELAINVAGAGANAMVAAVALKTIKVYGFFLISNGAVNLKWQDGGADFHPVFYLLGQGASWMLPRDGNPWFTGTVNTALNLNLSGAVQVSGRLYYIQD